MTLTARDVVTSSSVTLKVSLVGSVPVVAKLCPYVSEPLSECVTPVTTPVPLPPPVASS